MFRCFAFPCSSFSTSASRCAAKKLRQSINNLSNVPPKQQFWMNKPKPFMPTNFAPLGSSKPVAQDFDYLLVLDFEATCIENDKIQPVQEIIEFPVIAINTDGWKETAIFHQYVKPTVNPILTTYCTSLTGIIQEMVDNGKTLSEVLEDFDFWLEENQIKQTNFTFVSCGDWDLQLALPSECQAKEIEMPEYLTKWINVKKAYAEHTGEFPKGLKDLLARCNLTFEGRVHSGIDDTRNICKIAETLYKSGYKFRSTSTLELAPRIRTPRPLTFKPTMIKKGQGNRR